MICNPTFFVVLFFTISMFYNGFSQRPILPQSKHAFIVVAHRGNHTNAPENTLLAYQDAINVGVDFVEIDLRTTKDSQLVIMHNATIEHMTGVKGSVKDFLLDSLRLIKVREETHPEWGLHAIPTFKEVLQLCKGRVNIYLDFKEASVAAAFNEIKMAGMENNIVVYINAPQQFIDWRKVAPKMPLMISLPNAIVTEQAMLSLLDTYKVDVLDGNYNEYTIEMVLAAKEKKVLIWADIQSADDESHWDKALGIGLNGLQTDHPEALIKYLKTKGKR